MKGDLTTAINMHYWNIAGREQVFLTRVNSHCEYWRMFGEPDLVRRRFVTRVREFLHLTPKGYVVLASEVTNGDRWHPVSRLPVHKAMSTSSCPLTSR